MRVKMRWDADYLYIGAELREPYVEGSVSGHNRVAPYGPDNDFEVFVDVSGTTEYYTEFEMSLFNNTYDVKWGVPDQAGLACGGAAQWGVVPTCMNTSYPHGDSVGWTMATQAVPASGGVVNGSAGTTAVSPAQRAGNGGMLSATSWDPESFQRYMHPSSTWTAEIRFPIRQTPGYSSHAPGAAGHGGLLDADPVLQPEYAKYDPNLGDAGPGRPRYWWLDFARAEHPRLFTLPDGTQQICPLNCTKRLEQAIRVGGVNTSLAKQLWPTILGSYWEWVWGEVGDAPPGSGYMHNPSAWPLIQFAPYGVRPDAARCRNIEFPARHVALSLHFAQVAFARRHNGSFSGAVAPLVDAAYCSGRCDLLALRYAAAHPQVFRISINVTRNASRLDRRCTARPCFAALVSLHVPAEHVAPVEFTPPRAAAVDEGSRRRGAEESAYAYDVGVNENRYIWVHHPVGGRAPCL